MGVVLLLFQVGLESNLRQMARVGGAAFAVATIGVVMPILFLSCQLKPLPVPASRSASSTR